MENYPDKSDRELIKAFLAPKTEAEMQSFLRDILSLPEIKEISNRFQIAKMLWSGGQSYAAIAEKAKTSTTTVTRVADWLYKKGLNGYQTVLNRLYPKLKRRSLPAKGSLKVFP